MHYIIVILLTNVGGMSSRDVYVLLPSYLTVHTCSVCSLYRCYSELQLVLYKTYMLHLPYNIIYWSDTLLNPFFICSSPWPEFLLYITANVPPFAKLNTRWTSNFIRLQQNWILSFFFCMLVNIGKCYVTSCRCVEHLYWVDVIIFRFLC